MSWILFRYANSVARRRLAEEECRMEVRFDFSISRSILSVVVFPILFKIMGKNSKKTTDSDKCVENSSKSKGVHIFWILEILFIAIWLTLFLCMFVFHCKSIFAHHHRHRITLKNVELHKLHKWKIIIHYHELENWTNKQGISTKKRYIQKNWNRPMFFF